MEDSGDRWIDGWVEGRMGDGYKDRWMYEWIEVGRDGWSVDE